MNKTTTGLSARLASLAAWIPPGSRVLDVGTDHALLPIDLVQRGQAVFAIAADVARGPYETAKRNVAASGWAGQIEVRIGSGLSVIEPGEVDTVVIAGMGGATIADILEADRAVCASITHFLFQPMNATGRLRETLQTLRLALQDERMVKEAGRFYQLICAQPEANEDDLNAAYRPYIESEQAWLAREFGPLNLARAGDELVREAVEDAHQHITEILGGFHGETGAVAVGRRNELQSRLEQLEAWLRR